MANMTLPVRNDATRKGRVAQNREGCCTLGIKGAGFDSGLFNVCRQQGHEALRVCRFRLSFREDYVSDQDSNAVFFLDKMLPPTYHTR